jgi:ribosomal protein S18 acetylase RimI-like enzyme
MMQGLRLRPVEEADQAFLLAVYGATRQEEIAGTGWDADTAARFVRMQFDAQHAHYRQHHPHGNFDVVLHEDTAVGRLYVSRSKERLHVVEIAFLPQQRGRGFGSALLDQLLCEAQTGGKSVTIHVEMNNPAMAWYQRLGFKEIGTGGFHRLMEWIPAAPGAARN